MGFFVGSKLATASNVARRHPQWKERSIQIRNLLQRKREKH
jgi:hypothetical protein